MLHRVVAYTPVFRTFAHYVLRCITYWSPFLSSRFGALLRNLDGSLTLLPISSLLLLARITVISWRRVVGKVDRRRGADVGRHVRAASPVDLANDATKSQ